MDFIKTHLISKIKQHVKEKQDILEFIQKNLLDKDIRNLLM